MHNRIPALDGIRGIAILLVLALHLFDFSISHAEHRFFALLVETVAGLGWSGVDLFFVLSGFLITNILYSARLSQTFFFTFFKRRILRIFPLYYFYLLIYSLFLLITVTGLIGTASHAQHFLELPWLLLYGTNLRTLYSGTFMSLFVGHFWSLAVEEHFYLFWPFIVKTFSRERTMVVCAFIVIGSAVLRVLMLRYGSDPHSVYVFTFCRADCLAIGSFVALYRVGKPVLTIARKWVYCVGAVSLTFLVMFHVIRGGISFLDPLAQQIAFPAVAFFYASLIGLLVFSTGDTLVSSLFSSPLLSWFGKYSYGIYVFHPAAKIFTYRILNERLRNLGYSDLCTNLTLVAGALLFSLGAAWLSWNLIEKRFLVRGKIDRGDLKVLGGNGSPHLPKTLGCNP